MDVSTASLVRSADGKTVKLQIKDLTLSILVIAVIVLLADCVWLHVKCSHQSDAIAAQASAISSLNAALQAHVNPPPEPSMADKAKEAYERAKVATVAGYEKAKVATTNGYENAKAATARQYEKVKAAASAGYRAAKEKYKENTESK